MRAQVPGDVERWERCDGRWYKKTTEREMRKVRGQRISMIMQDPKFSLNPVMTIGQQMVEAHRLNRAVGQAEAVKKSREMLDAVAIRDPERVLRAYPHEMSGGMGQRIMIAMMLIPDPEILIADDPVLRRNLRTFTGSLTFDSDAEGRLEEATRLSSADGAEDGVLVLRGKAMQNGSPLTAWAFREGLGGIAFGNGHLLVTMAVFFFGLSTAISWSYYGDRSILYLAGPRWVMPYRVVFCIAHFLGAVYSLELVWAFGDMALGLMTIPNLISILLLTGLVKGWVGEYVIEGKLEPPKH